MTPATAAGRALLMAGLLQDDVQGARVADAIAAIEREAAQQERERIAAEVEHTDPQFGWLTRERIAAILAEPSERRECLDCDEERLLHQQGGTHYAE